MITVARFVASQSFNVMNGDFVASHPESIDHHHNLTLASSHALSATFQKSAVAIQSITS